MAASAKNVGVEDAESRAAQVAGADALDEARYIDVRWAGAGAGRVEAVEATIRFNDGGLRLERRFDIAEALAQQEIVG